MYESDFILNDTDIEIRNGDFLISDANAQNIGYILMASKGTNKEYPLTGADLLKIRNAPIPDFRVLLSEIKAELKKDGYKTVTITSLNNQNLDINAKR